MQIVNHMAFQEKMMDTLNQAVVHHEVVNISTPNGTAVLVNAEEYYALLDTLAIYSNPDYMRSLIQADSEPLEGLKSREELGI